MGAGKLQGVALGRWEVETAGATRVEGIRGEGAQQVGHWKCRNTVQRLEGEGAKGSVVSIGRVRREFWNTGVVR